MNVKQKLAELNLPKNSYVIVGSGILGALGIRDSNDIDIVVTQEVFEQIEQLGWERGSWSDQPVFKQDVFDIGNDWYGKTALELLPQAQVVNGIPYLSLDDVYEWKKKLARVKDIRDVKLIDEYRSTH